MNSQTSSFSTLLPSDGSTTDFYKKIPSTFQVNFPIWDQSVLVSESKKSEDSSTNKSLNDSQHLLSWTSSYAPEDDSLWSMPFLSVEKSFRGFPSHCNSIGEETRMKNGKGLCRLQDRIAWRYSPLVQATDSNEFIDFQKPGPLHESSCIVEEERDFCQDDVIFYQAKDMLPCSRNHSAEQEMKGPLENPFPFFVSPDMTSYKPKNETDLQLTERHEGDTNESSRMVYGNCLHFLPPYENPANTSSTSSPPFCTNNNDVYTNQDTSLLTVDSIFNYMKTVTPLSPNETSFVPYAAMTNEPHNEPLYSKKNLTNTNETQHQEPLYKSFSEMGLEQYEGEKIDTEEMNQDFSASCMKGSSSGCSDYYMLNDQVYFPGKNANYGPDQENGLCQYYDRVPYDSSQQNKARKDEESCCISGNPHVALEKVENDTSFNSLLSNENYNEAHGYPTDSSFITSSSTEGSLGMNLDGQLFYNGNDCHHERNNVDEKTPGSCKAFPKTDLHETTLHSKYLKPLYLNPLTRGKSQSTWLPGALPYSQLSKPVADLDHSNKRCHLNSSTEDGLDPNTLLTANIVEPEAYLTNYIRQDQCTCCESELQEHPTQCTTPCSLGCVDEYDQTKDFYHNKGYKYDNSNTVERLNDGKCWPTNSELQVLQDSSYTKQPTLNPKSKFYEVNKRLHWTLPNSSCFYSPSSSSLSDTPFTSTRRLDFLAQAINTAAMLCVCCILVGLHWILWVIQQWCLWKKEFDPNFIYDIDSLLVCFRSDLSNLNFFSHFFEIHAQTLTQMKANGLQFTWIKKEEDWSVEWCLLLCFYFKEVIFQWISCFFPPSSQGLKKDNLMVEDLFLTKNETLLKKFVTLHGNTVNQNPSALFRPFAELLFKDDSRLVKEIFKISNDDMEKHNNPIFPKNGVLEETIIFCLINNIRNIYAWFKTPLGSATSSQAFVKDGEEKTQCSSVFFNDSLPMLLRFPHLKQQPQEQRPQPQQVVPYFCKSHHLTETKVEEFTEQGFRTPQHNCCNASSDRNLFLCEVNVSLSQLPQTNPKEKQNKKESFTLCGKRNGDPLTYYPDYSTLTQHYQKNYMDMSNDNSKIFQSSKASLDVTNAPSKALFSRTSENHSKPENIQGFYKVKKKSRDICKTKELQRASPETSLDGCNFCSSYDFLTSNCPSDNKNETRAPENVADTLVHSCGKRSRRSSGARRSLPRPSIQKSVSRVIFDAIKDPNVNKSITKNQKETNKKKNTSAEIVEKPKENDDYAVMSPNSNFLKRSYAPGLYFDRRRRGFRIRFQNIYVGWVSLSRYPSYEQAYSTAKMIWDNAVYQATAHQNRQAALHAGIPLQIQNRLHVRNPGGRPRTVSRLSPLINAEILVAVNTAKRSQTTH